ncbi:sulfotransferase family protein [Halanaerobium saccharolyticum]|uniref:sulfotransferase family protein n=1 Tax=Halanaerobium saccharolyticum TaxID=43595 RepID=UPI003FCE1A9C
MRKLDFIIVGAMKSGTSSLAYHLNNHPNIYLPNEEIHFFNNDIDFKKGYDYYHRKIDVYNNEKKIIGEKTPTYSYLEKVPKRIYKYNPNIKLIWIFRNPVDRTYSNYLHAWKKGSENLSFEEAISQEKERIKDNIWKGYKKRSIYVKEVRRYLKYFNQAQMRYILFENFIKNPESETKKIIKFLGANEEKFNYIKEKRNKTTLPRMQNLLYFVRKNMGDKSIIYRSLMKILTFNKEPGYPKLDSRLRKKLKDYFYEYNKELKQITGLETDIWN